MDEQHEPNAALTDQPLPDQPVDGTRDRRRDRIARADDDA